jgi:hypothetical protein
MRIGGWAALLIEKLFSVLQAAASFYCVQLGLGDNLLAD